MFFSTLFKNIGRFWIFFLFLELIIFFNVFKKVFYFFHKSSISEVKIVKGTGKIIINQKNEINYFQRNPFFEF